MMISDDAWLLANCIDPVTSLLEISIFRLSYPVSSKQHLIYYFILYKPLFSEFVIFTRGTRACVKDIVSVPRKHGKHWHSSMLISHSSPAAVNPGKQSHASNPDPLSLFGWGKQAPPFWLGQTTEITVMLAWDEAWQASVALRKKTELNGINHLLTGRWNCDK